MITPAPALQSASINAAKICCFFFKKRQQRKTTRTMKREILIGQIFQKNRKLLLLWASPCRRCVLVSLRSIGTRTAKPMLQQRKILPQKLQIHSPFHNRKRDHSVEKQQQVEPKMPVIQLFDYVWRLMKHTSGADNVPQAEEVTCWLGSVELQRNISDYERCRRLGEKRE